MMNFIQWVDNMAKTILITGSTDGIGFLTAKKLLVEGQNVIIHGRSIAKVEKAKAELGNVDSFIADLSDFNSVKKLAEEIKAKYSKLDVLINNAGVYKVEETITADNLDVRFVVNTIAPYLLTKELLSILDDNSRIVNLSSAAQAPVSLEALEGRKELSAGEAYAQSKLALTMWTAEMAKNIKPMIVAVNPGSLLASKMVKTAYGIEGSDLNIGADILVAASLSNEFANASGKYFDNDSGRFANPHKDATNASKNAKVVEKLEEILEKL